MEIKPRYLRTDLQESINSINNEIGEFTKTQNYYKTYEAICELFASEDIDVLIESCKMLPLLYQGIVEKEEAMQKGLELLGHYHLIKRIEGNKYEEAYDVEKIKKKVKNILDKFKQERDRYKEELISKKRDIYAKNELKRKYGHLKSKLDHNLVVTPEDIAFLAKYMIEKGFQREQQILNLEDIRIHNQKIEHPDYKVSQQVKLMIHSGYHEYKISNLQKLQYTKYQADIVAFQNSLDKNQNINQTIQNISESEKKYESLEVYFFILKSLINIYVQMLNQDIQDLKDHYEDIDLRKVILAEYNDHRKRYNALKILFDKKMSVQKENGITQDYINELYYSGKGTAYLERDLKSFPEEKLLELKELLEKKKLGILTPNEDKPLNNNEKLEGLRKLKGDQVRICYRNIGSNKIAIVGAFIKKSDYSRMYEIMAARPVGLNFSDEEHALQEYLKSQAAEARIMDFIEENQRKGSR